MNAEDEFSFRDLPPETQAFLRSLRAGDVQLLEESISLVRSFMLVGRVTKWCLVLVVGSLVGLASFGKAISEVKAWFVR